MLVECHVFGSRTGYTTLARSGGVTDRDCRDLESGSFAFGQSGDRSYLDSLATRSAFFTRVLSGRRALTRVLKGSPDESNRPTLLMITAILSQVDWDQHLQGDIEQLLAAADLWKFASGAAVSAVEVTAAPPRLAVQLCQSPKILALISAMEEAGHTGRPAVLAEGDCGHADIAALEMLMPCRARRSFTTAYRSLSPSLPVSVNVLASQASLQKINRRPYDSVAVSSYARQLQTTAMASGKVPVELISRGGFTAKAVVMPPPAPNSLMVAPVTHAAPPRVSTALSPIPDYKPIAWWMVAAIPAGVLIAGVSIFWFARTTAKQTVPQQNPAVVVRSEGPVAVAVPPTSAVNQATTEPIKPEQVRAAFQWGMAKVQNAYQGARNKLRGARRAKIKNNKNAPGNNDNAESQPGNGNADKSGT